MVIAGICGTFAVCIVALIFVMKQVAANERAKGVDIGRQGCERDHNAVLVAERTRLIEECNTQHEQLAELERQLAQHSPKIALLEVYRTVRDEITRIEQQLKDASQQYKLIGEDTQSVLNRHWSQEKTREHIGSNNNVRTDFETNVFPTFTAQLEAARKRLLEVAAEVAALDTKTVAPATDLTKA